MFQSRERNWASGKKGYANKFKFFFCSFLRFTSLFTFRPIPSVNSILLINLMTFVATHNRAGRWEWEPTQANIKLQRKYIFTRKRPKKTFIISHSYLSSHNRCAISKSSCRRTLRRRARCLTIHRNFCRRAWALEKWVVYQGLFILIGYTHSTQ